MSLTKSRVTLGREVAAFLVVGVLIVVLFHWAPIGDAVLKFMNGRRDGLYSTIASLEGTLLGFVLAALTIVLGYSQAPRFEILRQSRHWGKLFGIYLGGVRWTAVATVCGLIGLVLDQNESPNVTALAVVVVSVAFSIYSISRVLWATEGVVRVVISEKSRAPGQ